MSLYGDLKNEPLFVIIAHNEVVFPVRKSEVECEIGFQKHYDLDNLPAIAVSPLARHYTLENVLINGSPVAEGTFACYGAIMFGLSVVDEKTSFSGMLTDSFNMNLERKGPDYSGKPFTADIVDVPYGTRKIQFPKLE